MALIGKLVAMIGQAQAGELGQLQAVLAAEQRRLALGRGKRLRLQAAEEQRAHATCAQVQRIDHRHRALARMPAAAHLNALQHPRELRRVIGRQLGSELRELLELLQRAPAGRQRARVLGRLILQHLCHTPPRPHEQPLELCAGARDQRLRVPLGRAQPAERVKRPALLLPQRAHVLGRLRTLAQRARLEPVGELGALEHTGSAEPREHILAARALRCARAAQRAQQRRADRRVAKAPRARERKRNARAREHLFQQIEGGRRRAQRERDLLRRDSLAQELSYLARHELELPALAASLQKAHRAAGVPPPGVRHEQRALEVRERSACTLRVVAAARRQLAMLSGQRRERLEAARATGEGRARRLVGERHRHASVDHRAQRLDRIELQPREIVEAVEQHRSGRPQRRPAPQGVQSAVGALLGVGASDARQLSLIALEHRS